MRRDRPSSSAFTVLQGLLVAGQNPSYGHLVSPEAREIGREILSSCPEGRRRLRQSDSWSFKLRMMVAERLMPALPLHYALRKRFIEDYTLEAIRRGATQVINLGSGFDSLVFRLSLQAPRVNFMEIDHPATSRVKVDALKQRHKIPENLFLARVDFNTETILGVLGESRFFEADRPTLFILEGVVMYLEERTIYEMFQSLSSLTRSQCDIIMTYVVPAGTTDNLPSPLLKTYLKFIGEPILWECDDEYLEKFLDTCDYELRSTAGADEFKRRYLGADYTHVLNEGERIAVASYRRPADEPYDVENRLRKHSGIDRRRL